MTHQAAQRNCPACTATVIAVQVQRRARAAAARVWVVLVEREVDAAAGDDLALGSTMLLQGTELPMLH